MSGTEAKPTSHQRRATAAAPGANSPRARVTAADVFFPAAALYGAAAVPLSLHGMRSGQALLPGFATFLTHAHELLFGYALAVVAGFLVTRASPGRVALLAVLWAGARASFLASPGSAIAVTLNVAFAAMLAWTVVPPFLRAAKKLRNKAVAPLLVALCLAVMLFQFGGATMKTWLQFHALQQGVLLLALLMLFMGGRIIAPAAAGAIQHAGGHLEARVQPRIEGILLIVMALAAVSLAAAPLRAATGGLLLAAAVLALVRLARWRLWACTGRPDLWCLGVGYLWLAVGLALLGLSWMSQLLPAATATHAITVGALGTLTTTVMLRHTLLRSKRDPASAQVLCWITGLIALAALARMLGSSSLLVLGLAAASWSLALIVLFGALLRVRATPRRADAASALATASAGMPRRLDAH